MKSDLLQFGSLLTWWWLPSLGSQLLLNACYSLQIITPPPPAAARTRNKHIQLARAVVIVGTLFYQLFQSATTAQANYYQLLGLPLSVDSEDVKRSFRALARRYHPDKVGEQGEAFFIHLRRAHDTLSDPVKRFAYDRFGPSIAEWKDCESLRDYMRRGLTSLVAFYTINPALYALFGFISSSGTRSDGLSFWRLTCLFSLLAFELCLLITPESPAWLTVVLPRTTVFEARQLSHSLFVNFFFASLQLSAALDVLEYGEAGAPARDKTSKAAMAERQMMTVSMKAHSLDQTAQMVRLELLRGFAGELRPFRGKREKGLEMSVEEEELFGRIDAVLLSRSLVQHNPQLSVAAGKPSEVTSHDSVKEEEDDSVAPLITIKEEPKEEVSPGLGVSPKPEEPTVPIRESMPHTVIKEEPKDDGFSISTGGTTDADTPIATMSEASALEGGSPNTLIAATEPQVQVQVDPSPGALPQSSSVAASANDGQQTKAQEATEGASASVVPRLDGGASDALVGEAASTDTDGAGGAGGADSNHFTDRNPVT